MKRDQTTEVMIAAAFGTLSGMRAFSGPVLAAFLRALNEDDSGILEDRLSDRRAVLTMAALALGEVIADKLPGAGDRIDAIPLTGRILAGALAGALVCQDERPERFGVTAGVGALAAIGGALAAFHLRRSTAETTGLPQPLLGLIEDAIVYGTGTLLIQQLAD